MRVVITSCTCNTPTHLYAPFDFGFSRRVCFLKWQAENQVEMLVRELNVKTAELDKREGMSNNSQGWCTRLVLRLAVL